MIDNVTRVPTTKRDNAFLVEEDDGYPRPGTSRCCTSRAGRCSSAT